MRRTLTGMLLIALLGSCTLLSQVQRIGVSTDGEGGLIVHHQPCPDETLTGITLAIGDPEEGGTVIWQVAGMGSGGAYPVGTTPEGMTEMVAFTPPPADAGLHLEVATQRGGATLRSSLSFTEGGLSPDGILTFGGAKDPETFRQEALETCEED